MGKGGGSKGLGDMLQYGNKALALQEKIYEEGKGYAQPYYQAGQTGLNELMFRLGLGSGQGAAGATAGKSREDLINLYKPQFTSSTTTTGGYAPNANFYTAISQDNPENVNKSDLLAAYQGYQKYGASERLKPYQNFFTQNQATSSTTDTTGLNSYVDKLMSDQAAAAQAAQSNPLYGSLLQNYTGQDIYNDPSYKFRYEQGQKAAERALAAQGKYLAPAGAQALQAYGQEMASQEYGNAYNRFVNDQSNIYNRLANIAGLGQTATGQMLGVGQNYANAATDLYTGMGNSIAAAKQASAANKGSMFNTLLGTAGQIGAAYFMSDPALKKNAKLIGNENGHNLYEFQYKDDPDGEWYIGVMADEVAEKAPEAVREVNGFLAVDYDKIGVKFRKVSEANDAA